MKSIVFTSEEKSAKKAIDNAFDEFDGWLRSHIGTIISLSHNIVKDETTGNYLASIILVVTKH